MKPKNYTHSHKASVDLQKQLEHVGIKKSLQNLDEGTIERLLRKSQDKYQLQTFTNNNNNNLIN